MASQKRTHESGSGSDSGLESAKRTRADGGDDVRARHEVPETMDTYEVRNRRAYMKRFPHYDADAPYGARDEPNLPQFSSVEVYQNISVCASATARPWWPACRNADAETEATCAMADVVAFLGGTPRVGVAAMTGVQIEDQGTLGVTSQLCVLCCVRAANEAVAHANDPVPWAGAVPTPILRTHTEFRVIREMTGGYITDALLDGALVPTRLFRYTDYGVLSGSGAGVVECVDLFYRTGPSVPRSPLLARPGRQYGIPASPRIGAAFAAAAPRMPEQACFAYPSHAAPVHTLAAHETVVGVFLAGRPSGGWCRKPIVSYCAENAVRDNGMRRGRAAAATADGVPTPIVSPHMYGTGNLVPFPRRDQGGRPVDPVFMGDDSAPNGMEAAFALLEALAAPVDDDRTVATEAEFRAGGWINGCYVAAAIVMQFVSVMTGVRTGLLTPASCPRTIDVLEYLNVRGDLIDDMHSVRLARRSRAALETRTMDARLHAHMRDWFDPLMQIDMFDAASDRLLAPTVVPVDVGATSTARFAIVDCVGPYLHTYMLAGLQPFEDTMAYLRDLPDEVVRGMFADASLGGTAYYNPLVAPGVTVAEFLAAEYGRGDWTHYALAAIVMQMNAVHHVGRVARAAEDRAVTMGITPALPTVAETDAQLRPVVTQTRRRTSTKTMRKMTEAQRIAHEARLRANRAANNKAAKLLRRTKRVEERVRAGQQQQQPPSATPADTASATSSEIAGHLAVGDDPITITQRAQHLTANARVLKSALMPLAAATFGSKPGTHDRRARLADAIMLSRHGVASVYYPWEHSAWGVGYLKDFTMHALQTGMPSSVLRQKPFQSVCKDQCIAPAFLAGAKTSRVTARAARDNTRYAMTADDETAEVAGSRDIYYWQCAIEFVYAMLTGAYTHSARAPLSATAAMDVHMALVCGWGDPVPLLSPAIVLHALRAYVLHVSRSSPAMRRAVDDAIHPVTSHPLFPQRQRAAAAMVASATAVRTHVDGYWAVHVAQMEMMRMAFSVGHTAESVGMWAARAVRPTVDAAKVGVHTRPVLAMLLTAHTNVDGKRKKGGFYQTSKYPPPVPLVSLDTNRALTNRERAELAWLRPAMRPAGDFDRKIALIDIDTDNIAEEDLDAVDDADALADVDTLAAQIKAASIADDGTDVYGLAAMTAADAVLRPTWSRTRAEEVAVIKYAQTIPPGSIPTPRAMQLLGLTDASDLAAYTRMYAIDSPTSATSSAQCGRYQAELMKMTAHGYSLVRLMVRTLKRMAAFDTFPIVSGDMARLYERHMALVIRDGFGPSNAYDKASLPAYVGILDYRYARVPGTVPTGQSGAELSRGECLTDIHLVRASRDRTLEAPTSLGAMVSSRRFRPEMAKRLALFSRLTLDDAPGGLDGMFRDGLVGVTVCCKRVVFTRSSESARMISSGLPEVALQYLTGCLECGRRPDPQRDSPVRKNAREKMLAAGVAFVSRDAEADMINNEKLPLKCHRAEVITSHITGSMFHAAGMASTGKERTGGGPSTMCINCMRPFELVHGTWTMAGVTCGFCRTPAGKAQMLRDTQCKVCPVPACGATIATSGPVRMTAICTFVDDAATPPLLVTNATVCTSCTSVMRRTLLCDANNVYRHPGAPMSDIEFSIARATAGARNTRRAHAPAGMSNASMQTATHAHRMAMYMKKHAADAGADAEMADATRVDVEME